MAERRKKAFGRHGNSKRRPPKITALNGEKLIPFGWYGGKFSHPLERARVSPSPVRSY